MSDQRSSSLDSGDDIRLLGRLLGDVLREQSGDRAFDLVERTRQVAVAGRRDGNDPIDELTRQLVDADLDSQVHLIRAFGLLSLLANTAEDVHVERRRRHHRNTGSRSQDGSLPATFELLHAAGVAPATVVAELQHLMVGPVITAHPTEVRRKTVLDHVDTVADLLDRRALTVPGSSG